MGRNKNTGTRTIGFAATEEEREAQTDVLKRAMSAPTWTRASDNKEVEPLSQDGEEILDIKEYEDRIVVVTTAGQKYNVAK